MSINIGIIGLGYWGPNLLRNFWNEPECKVVMCCDINSDRFKKIGKSYPGIEFGRNAEEVFNHPDIQAVAIITPVNTHFQLVKNALNTGKHLVSKPLTSNIDQARQLVDLADEKGLISW
jgi:predicted dehydrogenase